MTTAYQKRRNKDRKHAALMKREPELREHLYGSMSPAMREKWVKPLDAPNTLQRARDREHGLDSATLYPARSPADDRNSRNSETEET